jgi:hypothetical protein
MDIKGIGSDSVDWIYLVLDRGFEHGNEPRVLRKARNFLSI